MESLLPNDFVSFAAQYDYKELETLFFIESGVGRLTPQSFDKLIRLPTSDFGIGDIPSRFNLNLSSSLKWVPGITIAANFKFVKKKAT